MNEKQTDSQADKSQASPGLSSQSIAFILVGVLGFAAIVLVVVGVVFLKRKQKKSASSSRIADERSEIKLSNKQTNKQTVKQDEGDHELLLSQQLMHDQALLERDRRAKEREFQAKVNQILTQNKSTKKVNRQDPSANRALSRNSPLVDEKKKVENKTHKPTNEVNHQDPSANRAISRNSPLVDEKKNKTNVKEEEIFYHSAGVMDNLRTKRKDFE